MGNNKVICRTFVGQTVKLGDEVVYLATVHKEGGGLEKCKCIGLIESAVSQWNIDILCTYSKKKGEAGNLHTLNNPEDIICRTGDGMTFWWREDGRES